MNAFIIAIGDELVTGQSVDTNSAWLSDRLLQRGVLTKTHITVADDLAGIEYALEQAGLLGADLAIVTGGLGPTADDLTRQALAKVMDAPLELDERSLGRIEAFFRQRGREMPDANRVQAMCPAGAILLDNSTGTAPGICAKVMGTEVWCFPGVPREMKAMFDEQFALPACGEAGRVILTALLHTFGAGESSIAPLLGEMMDRDRNPTVGTTAKQSVVSVRIRSAAENHSAARRQLDDTATEVKSRLGKLVFGRDEMTLADAVGALLREQGKMLATAESCTGGLIGKMLTDAPGSSAYYAGGWVTYSNALKHDQLGVPNELLEQHGAVSEQAAIAMAQGALGHSGADYALAVTGIAGPTGGTEEKPVGTVWIALASRGEHTTAEHHLMPFDREAIRTRTAYTALNMLRVKLLGE